MKIDVFVVQKGKTKIIVRFKAKIFYWTAILCLEYEGRIEIIYKHRISNSAKNKTTFHTV